MNAMCTIADPRSYFREMAENWFLTAVDYEARSCKIDGYWPYKTLKVPESLYVYSWEWRSYYRTEAYECLQRALMLEARSRRYL